MFIKDLVYAGLLFKNITCVNSFNPHKGLLRLVTLLLSWQGQKLRHHGVKQVVQSHTASG